MDEITILIADNERNIRIGLGALFNAEADMRLIGEAVTGAEAIRFAAMLQPDVILMDIHMPDIDDMEMNGVEATRRILNTSPHIGVLMLTMFEDDDSIFAAMRAGARGYLLKGSLKVEILRAIRAVHSGEVIFGAAIAQRMARYFAAIRPAHPSELFPELTDREREILNLIAQHKNNIEIAKQLSLSDKTIRNHVSNIFNKLQVVDRVQAILRAKQAGLGRK
ncbi:MAG: response regulator transcription factor [Anaerolineaceae bacterium]|nr:response regulator transcription factor [Anaerolineaceae bacterium]